MKLDWVDDVYELVEAPKEIMVGRESVWLDGSFVNEGKAVRGWEV